MMRTMRTGESFEQWLQRLRQLAEERELEWLVCGNGENFRAAYEADRSPEEELQSLADISEWRGCGCGGGS